MENNVGEEPTKKTRPNIRNHYGKRDAKGGQEAENIGDEADGWKT